MVLDAGALIAIDRDDRTMWARLAVARRDRIRLITHGGVVGQVWRGRARQARLGQALRAVEVKPLDEALGKLAGALLSVSASADVIDAALVALCAAGDRIYTSDPDDMMMLSSAARLSDVEIVRV
jgi:hypothetical protein